MATLTYNPNEQPEGELTADEQDSLEKGSAIQEQEEQLLAGKYKNAQDLEKAYTELQKKLGESDDSKESAEEESSEPEEQSDQPEESDADPDFLEKLWKESNDEYSEETLEKLKGMDPTDLAQMYLDYRQSQVEVKPLADEDVDILYNSVGGEETYQEMLQWAGGNLDSDMQALFDGVMEAGDPASCFFAVQALNAMYTDAKGVDSNLITGKSPKATKDVFRSQAEVVRAMNDPRYETDPAYRQDVFAKLENSDIQF
jgi:hypothetical protein